jgi:nitrite reductase/ring-hydroxylating ferredoxin subunit
MGLRDRLKATIKGLLGDAHASDPKPPPPRAAAPAPAAPKPAEAKPAAPKPAEAKPAAPKPAGVKPAEAKAPEAPAEAPAKATKAAKGKKAKEADAAEEWVDVGPAAGVVEGKAGSWSYKEWVVAVFRYQGTLYAVDNACRHEDGPVGEGDIKACKVQCPYHDWEYDFTTGECLSNPGNRLTTFHVQEADGRIRIGGVLREGTDERGGEHNDGLKVITR